MWGCMAKKYVPFYAIEGSVGKFGSNKTADVSLVQFFISELAKHPDFAGSKPAVPLAVDGMYGNVTQQWITWYQNFVKSKGATLIADGRIDVLNPVPADWPNTTGNMYTIAHLNFSFRKRFKTRHGDLESDPTVPPTLRATFKSADF